MVIDMTLRRKICFIIIFIIFIIFLSLGYFFINRRVQEDRLFADVSEISNFNYIENYTFPASSVTKRYLDVEKNIEQYLKSFSKQASKVILYGEDAKLSGLLSIDNYLADGPDFLDSISYIEERKSDFEQDMDSLLLYFDKSYVRQYISNCNLSSYYKKLFNRAMFDEGIYDNLVALKENFLDSSSYINQIYQGSLDVLEFLSSHSSDWKIEGEEIQFSTEELANQYTDLVSKIK